MTAVCRNKNCIYYEKGFCTREIVSIDQNGMCYQCWRKGQPWRAPEQGSRADLNLEEGKISTENGK